MQDYYKILGIPPGASIDDIKKAFRKLTRENHPDKVPSPEATTKARDIIEAYKILTD